MCLRLSTLFLLVLTLGGTIACAEEVTLCERDDQAGPGTNLSTAIAAGGSITFNCGRATILVTGSHEISRHTSIDGANRITLRGGGRSSMFTGTGSTTVLQLRNIALRSFGTGEGPVIHPSQIGVAPIIDGPLTVDLRRAKMTDFNVAVQVPANAGGAVTVEDSHFADGKTALFAGNVTVRRTRFERLAAAPIASFFGKVTIDDSVFVQNGSPSVFGRCDVKIRKSHFEDNASAGEAGALALGCNAEIVDSRFTNNRASNGGAIVIRDNATRVTIRGSRFLGNAAIGAGGALHVRQVELDAAPPRVVEIRYGSFRNNKGGLGGAVAFDGSSADRLRAAAVLFAGNTAGVGGAVRVSQAGSAEIVRSVFLGNEAEDGGGLAWFRTDIAEILVVNSLFARNKATRRGAAYFGSSARFVNTTVAENEGVGVFLFSDGPGRLSFKNTVLTKNSGGNCVRDRIEQEFVDLGNNIQFPGDTCGSAIDTIDPVLDSFYMPFAGGPAHDHGDTAACRAHPVSGQDLYSQRRPRGSVCSAGAIEGDIKHLLGRIRSARRHEAPE